MNELNERVWISVWMGEWLSTAITAVGYLSHNGKMMKDKKNEKERKKKKERWGKKEIAQVKEG